MSIAGGGGIADCEGQARAGNPKRIAWTGAARKSVVSLVLKMPAWSCLGLYVKWCVINETVQLHS